MNVVLICRPRHGVDPSSSFPSHLVAERAQLRRLRTNGTLSAAYSPGGPGAVLMLNVPDHDTADRKAAELPWPRRPDRHRDHRTASLEM